MPDVGSKLFKGGRALPRVAVSSRRVLEEVALVSVKMHSEELYN